MQELRAAHVNGQITIGAEEWSSTTFWDSVSDLYKGMSINGPAMQQHTTTDVLPYRCASIPLTKDGLVIVPLSEPQDGSDPGKVKVTNEKTNADGSLK